MQFALTEKGKPAVQSLIALAFNSKANRLARIHAIWASATIGRVKTDAGAAGQELTKELQSLPLLLNDPDPEIRSQMLNLIADTQIRPISGMRGSYLLLRDPSPRVRLFAILRLAKKGTSDLNGSSLRDALFELSAENDNQDPIIRQACAQALSQRIPSKLLAESAENKSSSIRLTAVVALRRQKAPVVAEFLNDSDPRIVAEAARAINDVPIPAALPQLAALINKPDLPRVVAYRVLNANFLVGKPENAEAIASYAARPDVPNALRALAVRMLGEWTKPPRRDYITGLTQMLPQRPQADAKNAFVAVMGKLFAGPRDVRKVATTAATKLGIKGVGPFLIAMVNDAKAESNSRVEALNALSALNDPKLQETARLAVSTDDPRSRMAGRVILIKKDHTGVIRQLRNVLSGSNVVEQQGALSILAANPSADADALTEEWLDKLIAKKAKPELSLEILEAAAASKSERIKRRLAGYDNARPKDDLGKFRESLAGGDAHQGREIFLSKVAVQCQRCHKLNGEGGEVGPPLNGVGKQPREYLLESIVVPNKAIAKGYDSVLITTLDGKSVSGVLKGEDAKDVRLMTAEGKLVTIKKADIDDRQQANPPCQTISSAS